MQKERDDRLRAIRRIIKNERVDSQETLLGYLEAEGFMITQATLSRDLKTLRVFKTADEDGRYLYAIPSDEDKRENEAQYIRDFLRGYVSIDYNASLIVIKTFSGHSDSVAIAIENLGFAGVIGCLSGRDNTVFVALSKDAAGESVVSEMKAKIPELDI
jgi:transcriptional regulator of arginine metabolism